MVEQPGAPDASRTSRSGQTRKFLGLPPLAPLLILSHTLCRLACCGHPWSQHSLRATKAPPLTSPPAPRPSMIPAGKEHQWRGVAKIAGRDFGDDQRVVADIDVPGYLAPWPRSRGASGRAWRDIEQLIAEFCKAERPKALELQHALEVTKALKGAGWTPPKNSN